MLFWDVDTQVDFLTPGGKLYVPGSEKIIPNLGRLSCWAAGKRILIVADVDAHHEDDPEFANWPPHCLVGTPGQQKVPETLLLNRVVVPNRPVEIPKDLARYEQIIIEKQTLDVFTNPNIETVLARLGHALEVAVYGVVTEICVAYAVRGLLDRGHRVTLVRDAIHHLDEAKGRELIEEVVRRGGKIVTTDELLGESRAA